MFPSSDFTPDSVTIDNDADPALIVDFTVSDLISEQQIQCIVTNTNETVTVDVTVNPTAAGSISGQGISCTTDPGDNAVDCSELVGQFSGPFQLSVASTALGFEFDDFSGTDCTSMTSPIDLDVMDMDISCTANFSDIDACINNMCDANATCTDNPPPAGDDAAGRMCMCDAGLKAMESQVIVLI